MFTNTITITNYSYAGYIYKSLDNVPIASETRSCMIGNRMSASSVNRTIYPTYPALVKSVQLCVGWDQYGDAYINGSHSSGDWSNPNAGAFCGLRNIKGASSVYISSSGETVDECWYTFYYK